ncbi:MAG: lamin tail domain-containing protein [Fidelibacterota bacterium]
MIKRIYPLLYVLFWLLLTSILRSQALVINEVMFDAVGADSYDEYIELVNIGDTPVGLEGCFFRINDNVDTIKCNGTADILNPGAFGLILDRGYLIDHLSTTYDAIIPDGAVLCTVRDDAFGSNGIPNSAPATIVLCSPEGDTLSVMQTKPDQVSGYSEERIDVYGLDNLSNWGNSLCLYGTPGFENSIAIRDYDLGITRLVLLSECGFIPSQREGEFEIGIQNFGRYLFAEAEIRFGVDENGDSLLQSGEVIHTKQVSLASGDSTTIRVALPAPKPGFHRVLCTIVESDGNPDNNLEFLDVKVAYPTGCLAINEFMYAPLTGFGGEWIELLNVSEDTVNLAFWQICDATSRVVISAHDIYIPPHEYAVLTSDATMPDHWNPGGVFVLLETSLPTLNNTEDSVVVRDHCGQVVDSLKYSSSWGYQQGVSLERIDARANSDQAENWTLSRESAGGTPGYENSVKIREYDLAITRIGLQDESVILNPGDIAALYVVVKNIGRRTVDNAELFLGIDTNGDSILQQREVLYMDILTIAQGDSVVLYPGILDVRSGKNCVIGQIMTADDNHRNNIAFYSFNVSYLSGQVAINEFMYVPAAGQGGEWVELLNVSEDMVNLASWQICDAASQAVIADHDICIPPQGYAVLSSDEAVSDIWNPGGVFVLLETSLPTLNNTSDSIVVRDLCGKVIDSLKYTSSWGYRQGVSLERINPFAESGVADNWRLSVDSSGGTPGFPNSQMIKNDDLALDTIYVDTEYPSHNTPFEIKYRVGNRGLATVESYSVYLGINLPAAAVSGTIVMDTILYYENLLPTGVVETHSLTVDSIPGGVYEIYCETFLQGDEQPENDWDSCALVIGYPPGCLVISEVMNVPESGESEWFEIYNPSDFHVDLNRWSFRDAGGGWQMIADQTTILESSGFLIIAARQDFLQTYPQFTGELIVPEKFPILNNSSDSLFLADGTSRMIEKVFFRQDWGGAAGISIERRDPNSPALNALNWGSSEHAWGATPGFRNSILKYHYDLAIMEGSFQFAKPVLAPGEMTDFELTVVNRGTEPSDPARIELYHDQNQDGNPAPAELVWSSAAVPALLPDSGKVMEGKISAEMSGRNHYIAVLKMDRDEDLFDNFAGAELLISFPEKSLVLNEFFAYPNANQTEFVELVNQSGLNIKLGGWYLYDNRSAGRISGDVIIKNGAYLVLTQDSLLLEQFVIGDSAVVIVPSKWPGLSNSGDKIVIKDLTGRMIDSLEYTEQWGLKPGLSHEKRLLRLASEAVDNWSLSSDKQGATPGYINSITPRLYDLKMDSIKITVYDNTMDSKARLLCWFSNCGQRACAVAEMMVQCDDYLIATQVVNNIAVGMGNSLEFEIGPFESGIHCLDVFVAWTEDLEHGNDTLRTEIRTAFQPGSLLLSEFMAYPDDIFAENSPICEYIEIYNPAGKIPLKGWSVCDENTAILAEIREEKTIQPGRYFVLAADSTIFNYPGVNPENTAVLEKFPTLNNSADAIYIKDVVGRTIDSLVYTAKWEIIRNVSQERIRFDNPNTAENWRLSTAAAGGTPGYINSVAIDEELTKPGIKVEPNPFTPNGDGIDDEVAILYQLPFPSASVSVQVYDMLGRLIFEPARNLVSSSQGVVYWDGSSQYGNRARIGMYVVRLSATDRTSDKTVGYVTTVVLGR